MTDTKVFHSHHLSTAELAYTYVHVHVVAPLVMTILTLLTHYYKILYLCVHMILGQGCCPEEDI